MLALQTSKLRVSMLCFQHRSHSGWICGSQLGPGGNSSGLFIIDVLVFPYIAFTQRVLTKRSFNSIPAFPCGNLLSTSVLN